MKSQTRQASFRGYVGAAILFTVALALAMFYVASPVSAQEPDSTETDTPTHGESSDCFGGALSSDPIHCEVFQWAHNEGVVDVDAVYRAGKALYIYLTQTEELDDAARKKMLAKSQEVAQRTGEYECVLAPRLCGSGVLSAGRDGGYILPKSSVYQTIEVFPGGAEARRSSPGWQVFQQFWPEYAGGVGGATGTADDFDISEVDRTNFLMLIGNCRQVGVGSTAQRTAQEAIHHHVQLLTDARHLALGDTLTPQGLDQIVHPPRGYTFHVGLLDHSQQSSLAATPWLQQAREVAPLSELRDVQLHRPYTGIPRPGPIPVALGHPLRAAFSILSTDPR